jgi:hypothetical protein
MDDAAAAPNSSLTDESKLSRMPPLRLMFRRPAPSLRKLVDNLDDLDPRVREAARSTLMAIGRDDLPTLRQVVADARPLAPDQSIVLREVVEQAWLNDEPYDYVPDGGFLGLSWPDAVSDRYDFGVPVVHRLAGFSAARELLVGDIILRVLDDPSADCHDRDSFRQSIGRMAAGQTVHLRVLRRGRIIDVPIVLDRRPPQRSDTDNRVWEYGRAQRAAAYWDREFGPLLDESKD